MRTVSENKFIWKDININGFTLRNITSTNKFTRVNIVSTKRVTWTNITSTNTFCWMNIDCTNGVTFLKLIFINFLCTPCKVEQPLQGMELQQKEAQKD